MALFILFLGASGVELPTLLLPDLLPRPLHDMFVELLIYRKTDGDWCLKFKKPNDNLAGRNEVNERGRKPAAAAEL